MYMLGLLLLTQGPQTPASSVCKPKLTPATFQGLGHSHSDASNVLGRAAAGYSSFQPAGDCRGTSHYITNPLIILCTLYCSLLEIPQSYTGVLYLGVQTSIILI